MSVRMVKAEVIGFREYSFVGQKKEEVNMVQLNCTFDDDKITGSGVAIVQISGTKFSDYGITIGSEIRIIFAEKKWQFFDA